ncbi:cytochrome c [Lutibacter sp.]|uniref:c-type cytochrome n=1 Tax=Lutibacter sp. TaxID=1925666 RepID=UPI0025BB9AB8|nr:cytochrome c [Lutibacter sp.]MCF6181188.1 c-type cytochrome [Lutibacter sp.]
MKTTLTLLLLISATFAVNAQTWVAPKSADAIENPLKGNTDAIKKGKKLFTSMCVICHGAKGKGDGIAGAALNPKPANFTSKTVQAQSDGVLFWKLTNGNAPMASYKELLTEEQRWQLVNYLRTFKK